jgi:uncharacterized membrane protein
VSSPNRRGPSELKLFERLWQLHARLFISAAFGFAATLALPWRMPTRVLVGWDAGVLLYLVLSLSGRRACDDRHDQATGGDL